MFVRQRNGLRPVTAFRDEMDRLFEGFFGPVGAAVDRAGAPARTFPALNVWEQGDNLYAEAELPGLKNEDVEVSVVGNQLTIQGKRSTAADEGAAFHRRERGEGEFTRVVRLPVEINADKVQAAMRDGVLLVTLPKAEASKPRKIQVTSNK